MTTDDDVKISSFCYNNEYMVNIKSKSINFYKEQDFIINIPNLAVFIREFVAKPQTSFFDGVSEPLPLHKEIECFSNGIYEREGIMFEKVFEMDIYYTGKPKVEDKALSPDEYNQFWLKVADSLDQKYPQGISFFAVVDGHGGCRSEYKNRYNNSFSLLLALFFADSSFDYSSAELNEAQVLQEISRYTKEYFHWTAKSYALMMKQEKCRIIYGSTFSFAIFVEGKCLLGSVGDSWSMFTLDSQKDEILEIEPDDAKNIPEDILNEYISQNVLFGSECGTPWYDKCGQRCGVSSLQMFSALGDFDSDMDFVNAAIDIRLYEKQKNEEEKVTNEETHANGEKIQEKRKLQKIETLPVPEPTTKDRLLHDRFVDYCAKSRWFAATEPRKMKVDAFRRFPRKVEIIPIGQIHAVCLATDGFSKEQMISVLKGEDLPDKRCKPDDASMVLIEVTK